MDALGTSYVFCCEAWFYVMQARACHLKQWLDFMRNLSFCAPPCIGTANEKFLLGRCGCDGCLFTQSVSSVLLQAAPAGKGGYNRDNREGGERRDNRDRQQKN